MAVPADILFLDGKVITVDSDNSVAEAVAVKGNKIMAVGSSRDLESLRGDGTKVYALGGRSVLPGLIECHNHMGTYGTNKLGIDCKAPHIKSIEDIKAEVKKVAASVPAGSWIRGWGYDHSKLAEKRHPTRWDLDEVAPNHPVLITRTCGHIAVANSKALEMAGVHDGTSDPPGGKFERFDGRLTGVVFESAQKPLQEASKFSLEELKAALRITNDDWVKHGITSSHDAGGPEGMVRAMLEASASGDLKVRVYFMVWLALGSTQAKDFLKTGLFTGFGNDRVKLGCYKVMTDGSSSGPTAATRQPYTSQPGNSGMLYYSQQELDELIEEGHARGFQVTTHAVGDLGIEMTLNAIEKALAKWPRSNHRHRIEHCAICPPDLIARIKRLGIVPVPQPIFFWEFGDGYLRNYGPDRVRWMFPVKTFFDEGIIAAGSSDCPVTMVNPFFNMYLALTRRTQTGLSCGDEERVGLLEAIRLFTINGAYASFEEKIKGSLEPGKLADLIVLDRDIMACPLEEIKETRVVMTMIDGEVVYQDGEL